MKKKGFALVAVIFIILVVAMLSLATSSLISSEAFVAAKNYDSLRAFYIAEAGLQYTITASLEGSGDWSGFVGLSGSFANGSFSVTNVSPEADSANLQVTGTYGNVSRTIQQQVERDYVLPGAFNYALYWNNSAGSSSRLDIGGLFFDSDIVGKSYGNGNFEVKSGSSVTGGTLYVSSGHDVIGSGTYSWEATDSPSPWPSLDNSYYTSLINKYDALIPTSAVDAYTWSSSDKVITLEGEVVSFESITINTSGSLTIFGSGELVSRGDITVYGTLNVHPLTGETVALIADDSFKLSSIYPNSASLEAGTHIYSINDRCRFTKLLGGSYGTVTISNALIMSKTRVTMNWFGSRIQDDSIVYVPPSATGYKGFLDANYYVVDINISGTDIFHGSIISDCSDSTRLVRFLGGGMQGIIYSTNSPLRLVNANINGAVVADKFQYYQLFDPDTLVADITWAPSFLPSVPPPGLSVEVVSLVSPSWQEIY